MLTLLLSLYISYPCNAGASCKQENIYVIKYTCGDYVRGEGDHYEANVRESSLTAAKDEIAANKCIIDSTTDTGSTYSENM